MNRFPRGLPLLAALAVLLALSYGGPVARLYAGATLSMYLVAGWWVGHTGRNLSCKYDCARHQATAGETIPVRVVLYNDSFLPLIGLAWEDPLRSEPAAPRRTVPPLSSAVFAYTIGPLPRGRHRYGYGRASFQDPVGLKSGRREFSEGGALTVYPRVAPVGSVRIGSTQLYGRHRSALFAHEDPAALRDIRPYIPGDDPRRLHWKLTARFGDPYVRLFDRAAALEVCLIPDMACPDAARQEFIVSIAAGLARRVILAKGNVGLAAYAPDRVWVPPGGGRRKFMELMEAAVDLGPGTLPPAAVVAAEARNCPRRTVVAVITAAPGPELAAALLSAGRPALVVALTGQDGSQDALALVRRGITVWHVTGDRDLVAGMGCEHPAGA